MPSFADLISRTESEPLLMPEEVMREVFDETEKTSTVTRLATRLPNMAASIRRLPVLSVLPQVYFVGEKGRSPQTFTATKQTTQAAWDNKYLNAEEMACIVVIPENVLDDQDFDVWGQIRPQISAAIAAKIDSAILFGESNVTVPVAWPDGILVGMPAAHQVQLGEIGDLYDDLFGVAGVFAQVEEDGFLNTGVIAALSLRAKLRALRDGATGLPLFVQDMRATIPYSLDGVPLEFPRNGSIDPAVMLALAGDFKQIVWAVRRDVNFKIVTEGVITDESSPPQIQHNLLQEDLIGLRVTFRMAWQIPNPINRVNTNAATRYPFAALMAAGVSV